MSPEATLYWDDRGILLRARARALRAGDPWRDQGLDTVALPWSALQTVEDDLAWPGLRLQARERRRRTTYDIRWPQRLSRGLISRHLSRFVQEVERRAAVLRVGWLRWPETRWEPVVRLPSSGPVAAGEGPFRQAPTLTGRVEMEWRRWHRPLWVRRRVLDEYLAEGAARILVTAGHVYVSVGLRCARVARDSLRAHVRYVDRRSRAVVQDALVFGRRTELRLEALARRSLESFIQGAVPTSRRVFRLL